MPRDNSSRKNGYVKILPDFDFFIRARYPLLDIMDNDDQVQDEKNDTALSGVVNNSMLETHILA